jgi:DNA-binding response OmpR family regulator
MDLTGLRILLVEDEAMLSTLTEEYLEELGCKVVVAARLEDALEKARTRLVDVAVLDVNLAGQMSYPVAEILHARGVPVVFATGYGVAGLPNDLRTIPVMTKPFRQEQLAEAIGALAGGKVARSRAPHGAEAEAGH